MICTGQDALKAVAQPDGRWNWALLGPDPEAMPLAGGGAGSVEEMRGCMEEQEAESQQHANLYGLLRLDFGTGKSAKRKYVFVSASRFDETHAGASQDRSGGLALKTGYAKGQIRTMEKAISEYTHFTCQIEVMSLEDLTLEHVLAKVLQASTADSDLITREAYDEAMAEFRKTTGLDTAEAPEAQAEQAAAWVFEQECVPQASEAKQEEETVTAEEPPPAPPVETVKEEEEQAEEKSPFQAGDQVMVYSQAAGQWLDDGRVVMVLAEASRHDGTDWPAGAVKVNYNNGKTCKWLLADQVSTSVRPSRRPRPPVPLVGEIYKETHNWISEWHVRYAELCKGYLQWWPTQEDARRGIVPNGRLSLTGMELHCQENKFYVRTVSSKGVIYSFDATSPLGASKWVDALRKHQAYCQEMQHYLTKQAMDMRISELESNYEKLTGLVLARRNCVAHD